SRLGPGPRRDDGVAAIGDRGHASRSQQVSRCRCDPNGRDPCRVAPAGTGRTDMCRWWRWRPYLPRSSVEIALGNEGIPHLPREARVQINLDVDGLGNFRKDSLPSHGAANHNLSVYGRRTRKSNPTAVRPGTPFPYRGICTAVVDLRMEIGGFA